ncbi:MAG: 4Fe-4S single cluster domain-containing protein [Candidatus Wallbacteria bacterium]|nr:4Fe-4S single cluster domain-containing protein [Candidatus Wallbacteria bacterium]
MGNNTEATVLIDLVHFPVTALGPGVRSGIWFQGCRARCKGCIATHAQPFDQSKRIPVSEVLRLTGIHAALGAEGLTVSGGEPFDQPAALREILNGARRQAFTDILIYSRYRIEDLIRKFPWIREFADAVVDGEFQAGNASLSHWKGSGNQRMCLVTRDRDLRRKYREYCAKVPVRRSLQVIRKNDRVYVLGIPDQKDAERIHSELLQNLSMLR